MPHHGPICKALLRVLDAALITQWRLATPGAIIAARALSYARLIWVIAGSQADTRDAADIPKLLRTLTDVLAESSSDDTPALAGGLEDLLLREDSCYAHLGSSPSSASNRSGSGGGKPSTSSCGTVKQLGSSGAYDDAATSPRQLKVQRRAAALAEALHSSSSGCGSGGSGSCRAASLSSTDSAGFVRPPRRRSVRRRCRTIPTRAACQQAQPGSGFDALQPSTVVVPPPTPPLPAVLVPLYRQDSEPAAGGPHRAPQLQASTAPAGAMPVPMHYFVEQRRDPGRDKAPTAATAAAAAPQRREEARRNLCDLVAWPQCDPLAAYPRYSFVRKLSR